MKKTKSISVLLLTILLISACSSPSGELSVSDAWARPAGLGENGAAYFIIENGTTTDDTLLSVSSDIASATEVHMSMMMDGGVMSMQMQETVPVPSGEEVEFKTGGLHVMFIGLTRELKVGEMIKLTLSFDQTGDLIIEVPIVEP